MSNRYSKDLTATFNVTQFSSNTILIQYTQILST